MGYDFSSYLNSSSNYFDSLRIKFYNNCDVIKIN